MLQAVIGQIFPVGATPSRKYCLIIRAQEGLRSQDFWVLLHWFAFPFNITYFNFPTYTTKKLHLCKAFPSFECALRSCIKTRRINACTKNNKKRKELDTDITDTATGKTG